MGNGSLHKDYLNKKKVSCTELQEFLERDCLSLFWIMPLKKVLMTIVLRFEASYLPEYFYDIHNMSDCNISLISQNASALEVVHISQDFEDFGLNVWIVLMNNSYVFLLFIRNLQLYMINLLCPQKRCSVWDLYFLRAIFLDHIVLSAFCCSDSPAMQGPLV